MKPLFVMSKEFLLIAYIYYKNVALLLLALPLSLLIVNYGLFLFAILFAPILNFSYCYFFEKKSFLFYQNLSVNPFALLIVSFLFNIFIALLIKCLFW